MRSAISEDGYLTIDAEGEWALLVVDLEAIELDERAAMTTCPHTCVHGCPLGRIGCAHCGRIFESRTAWIEAIERTERALIEAVRVRGVNDKERRR